MYAIVEASGRQFQLEAGRFVDIDLVGAEPGDAYVFERVLMIVNGKDSQLGSPFLEGAKVNGRVLSHGKGRKIIVYRQRPKKGTRKKQGHRQHFTRVFIDSIQLNDKVLAEAKATAAPTSKPKAAKEEAAPDKKATEPKAKTTAKTAETKAAGAAKVKPAAATKTTKKAAGESAEKPAAKTTKKSTAKSDTKKK